MIILGIDPGNTGAMCLMNSEGDILETHIFEPIEKEFPEAGFISKFKDYLYENPKIIVYLEKVHSMPKQGVSSMFKFGKTFGFIQGVIRAHNIDINLVTPRKWMREIHFPVDSLAQPKVRSARAIAKIYPGIDFRKNKRCRNPHDGLVDATLIAEYGRRIALRG